MTAEQAMAMAPAGTPAVPAAAVGSRRRPAGAETRRCYATDWAKFDDWCRARDLTALPADPATVAAFLTAAAASLSAGTLGRRVAAIADQHRQHGLASPAATPAVRTLLRAARGTAPPRRRPPAKPAALLRMAARCPRDLAGLRDRALLLLAATGLSRAALVGLDLEHLRFTATGIEVSLAAGSRGSAGGGPLVLRRGASLTACPVRALQDWLVASDTSFGPVFRKIEHSGLVAHHRLGADAPRLILARRAPRRPRRPHRARQAAAA